MLATLGYSFEDWSRALFTSYNHNLCFLGVGNYAYFLTFFALKIVENALFLPHIGMIIWIFPYKYPVLS